MRVLLVHNRYRSTSPSGEDRVVDQEHAALEEAGHVVGRFERSSDEIAGLSLGRKVRLPVDAVWSRSAARDVGATISSFEPDVVHVMVDGRIVRSGGKDLALTLEEKGYEWIREAVSQTAPTEAK